MATAITKKIISYYKHFSQIDITFNKQVIEALGLQLNEVFLKCRGNSFPSIVYSASMIGARVISNLTPTHFEKIRDANNLVSLRLAFKSQDQRKPLSFFIPARVNGFNPFNKKNPNAHIVSLAYLQKPSDDLIMILGELLDSRTAANRRRDERIVITPASKKELGLYSTVAQVDIDSESRNCIIRDLSFSGAKILLVGVSELFVNKAVALQLSLGNRDDLLRITGKIMRFEEVSGREDIAAIGIQFDEKSVPLIYQMRLNAYLKNKSEI